MISADRDGTDWHVIIEKDAIDTIEQSCGRFSKRDQLKADIVQWFQHVVAFPLDTTLIYSVMMNSIKNSSFTKKDIDISNNILGKSKYVC